MHFHARDFWIGGLKIMLAAAMAFGTLTACVSRPTGPKTDEDIVWDRDFDVKYRHLDKDAKSLYDDDPHMLDRAQANILFRSAGRYFENGDYLTATALYDRVGQAYFDWNGRNRWPQDQQYAATSYYYGWSFDALCGQDPEYCGAFIRLNTGEQNVQAAADARVLTSYLAALDAPLSADLTRHAIKSCVEMQKRLTVSIKTQPRLSPAAQAEYQRFLKAKCE